MQTNLSEKIENTIRNSQNEADSYTYPVFIKDDRNKPDLIASSVVLAVEGRAYLVTAAHVFNNVEKTGGPFIIGVRGKYVNIKGVFTLSIGESEDEFDIAFVELDGDTVEENGIKILSYNKLAIGHATSRTHIALVHGYPNSRNKQSKALWQTQKYKVKAYAYSGIIKTNDIDWLKFNKDADIHVCMPYKKTTKNNQPTHPRGMSGGGLWIVPDIDNDSELRLQGIFIEYYEREQISFSTHIGKVVEFIEGCDSQ